MDYLYEILKSQDLEKHDGRALWKYQVSDSQYEELKLNLANSRFNQLHPRDAILYYALWWKNEYNGGKPSKSEIYNSLPANQPLAFDADNLYRLAKKGAQILGVKWIRRQNTLYFKSLLFQGGLPLNHISVNHGYYFSFLSAVLNLQPESIEDFADNSEVTSLLPVSNRNEVIFESCFEIVNAILNDDTSYDDLFSLNETLAKINNDLKKQKQTLKKRTRLTKPKIYWLLKHQKDKALISLHIGLADTYKKDALENILGFEPIEREYQLYIDDNLVCSFRKLLNENYITDWHLRSQINWNGEDSYPDVYVLRNGERHMLDDFISTLPTLYSPTLWTIFIDNQWRLVKGNGTENKEAALLYPLNVKIEEKPEVLIVNEEPFNWLPFEGEITLCHNGTEISFRSNTVSLNWSVIQDKPSWMQSANMPVVQKAPIVILYDTENNRINKNFSVTYKEHNSNNSWKSLRSSGTIDLGCLDLKIDCDGIFAYDTFFNIGNLDLTYSNQELHTAVIKTENRNGLKLKLYENEFLNILEKENQYHLTVDFASNKIPTSIRASFGQKGIKKLHFQITSPFKGMRIINADGEIIDPNSSINMEDLYGLRVLGDSKNDCKISLQNPQRQNVRIIKEISPLQPVITFKPDVQRLFYLSDAMDYENVVKLELISGNDKEAYYISAFTHSLDVKGQLNGKVSLYGSEDDLDLFAIPLNCPAANIILIDLNKNDKFYELPKLEFTRQFIIISSPENKHNLMPRYVNTDETYLGIAKEQRIQNYHRELASSDFRSEIWEALLAYFNICTQNNLPYSTFDQLRAISVSSSVAAKAFFFLGVNQYNTNVFIQKAVPEIELDLGFCFHWIGKSEWGNAINEVITLIGPEYVQKIMETMMNYFADLGLTDLGVFISNDAIKAPAVSNQDINSMRSRLGNRVIDELPHLSPRNENLNLLPVMEFPNIRLLLQSPIAVAESIVDIKHEFQIWGGGETREKIRRNIQYCQYLDQDFYNKALLYSITKLRTK